MVLLTQSKLTKKQQQTLEAHSNYDAHGARPDAVSGGAYYHANYDASGGAYAESGSHDDAQAHVDGLRFLG